MPAAGDFDYGQVGDGYPARRRTDPRIAAWIWQALGPTRSVLNVGAGAGSYEPADRLVTAVEPSAAMRAQRTAGLPAAIAAAAEQLPFADGAFDAAMAILTIHQWADLERGLAELRRVSSGPVVVLSFDPAAFDRFWLADYCPALIAAERRRFPTIDRVTAALCGASTVTEVPIPIDCLDGFTEAYYARPECFLDPAVRRAQSGWSFVEATATERALDRLRRELASGEWDGRYRALRDQPEFHGALRLVVNRPSSRQ